MPPAGLYRRDDKVSRLLRENAFFCGEPLVHIESLCPGGKRRNMSSGSSQVLESLETFRTFVKIHDYPE